MDRNVEDVRLEWLPVHFRIVPELPYLAGGGGGAHQENVKKLNRA